MNIQLNGHPEQLKEGQSLVELMEMKKINPRLVACELNLKVIKRAELPEVVLKEGDVLEIIRMIGGG